MEEATGTAVVYSRLSQGKANDWPVAMRKPTVVLARPTTTEPAAPASVFSLRNGLHVLFKRKWLALVFFVLCSAAFTAYSLKTTVVRYEATAEILVSPNDVALPVEGGSPARIGSTDEQLARTVKLLVGRSLAERVVRTIGPTTLYPLAQGSGEPSAEPVLVRSAAQRLLADLSARPAGGKSAIIYLSFMHQDPAMAARVVNLVAEQYVDRHLGVQKNPKTDAFLQEQLAVLKQRLSEAEGRLEASRRRLGILSNSPKDERDAALAEASGARAQLADLRARQTELRAQAAELNRQLALAGPPALSRSVRQQQDRLSTLEGQERELALRVTDQHPALRQLRSEIADLHERLKGFDSAPGADASGTRESLQAVAQADLARNRAETESLRSREAALVARMTEAQRRVTALEGADMAFGDLQRQVESAERTYRQFLARTDASRLVNAMDAERIVNVRVIEPAEPPLDPIESGLNRKLLFGFAASALGGIGLAFAAHLLVGRLDTSEDVRRELGLPVLASITQLKPQAGKA